jgi:catechol 2,3-dioxygenase-like lactoylglutathione lyase family enzyme
MKFICTLIVVEDVQKSRFLYEQILGQTVKMDYGENITFHGDFAIHQKSHFKSLINHYPILSKSNNFELYFEDDNLETIVKKLKDNGFEFIHKIVEQPWKQKVIRFYDYDKNIIEIGERMEHVAYRLSKQNYSIEEISKITYFPEDIVQKSIEEYSK